MKDNKETEIVNMLFLTSFVSVSIHRTWTEEIIQTANTADYTYNYHLLSAYTQGGSASNASEFFGRCLSTVGPVRGSGLK